MIIKLAASLEGLAERLERGDDVPYEETYDVGVEALGECYECGVWAGEEHLRPLWADGTGEADPCSSEGTFLGRWTEDDVPVLHAAQSELKSVIDLFQADAEAPLLAAALRAATDRLRGSVVTPAAPRIAKGGAS